MGGILRPHSSGFVEQRFRLHSHLCPGPLTPFRVHVVAVARRVDLNVIHALGGETRCLGLQNLGDGP